MKTVVYSCPYVPAEWIAAHGLRPNRIIPYVIRDATEIASVSQGLCPYARALIAQISRSPVSNGVVLTTVCDQMRRAADIVSLNTSNPVFLMGCIKTSLGFIVDIGVRADALTA